jgi:hypothetical protein
VITQGRRIRNNLLRLLGPGAVVVLGEAAVILYLAQRQGLWPLAGLAVIAVELWGLQPGGGVSAARRSGEFWARVPAVLMGLAAILIIAVSPRLATQAGVAVLFAVWRLWQRTLKPDEQTSLANLLLVQATMFEALFLAAGVWRHGMPEWLVVGLVWCGAYLSVYSTLTRRGERADGVMAATWALVAAEVSWVLLLWLFMYTVPGGYLIVPQPAVVLTGLAYCFGSIYVSQRQGSLSRGRLTEYLLIGLILIAIVITGTPWRGTL